MELSVRLKIYKKIIFEYKKWKKTHKPMPRMFRFGLCHAISTIIGEDPTGHILDSFPEIKAAKPERLCDFMGRYDEVVCGYYFSIFDWDSRIKLLEDIIKQHKKPIKSQTDEPTS